MSFARSLQALGDEDLRVLLSRRAEAAELAAHPRQRWGDLATALLRPRAVAATLACLDRFLAQVLQLACLEGGHLTAPAAAEEGLAPGDLERATHELRRWGLAEVDREGTLVVPPIVASLVGDPGGLGTPAAYLLEHLTADALRQIAMRHGLSGQALPKRKLDLASALRARLADRERVRALVSSAPPAAREALETLRRAGGTTRGRRVGGPWSETTYYHWETYGYARDHRDERDGVGWLTDRGLVLPEDIDHVSVGIPSEVERALRGRVFPRWDASPPALELAPLREEGHPAELVTAMDTVLEAWRHTPPTALKDGGVPKREMKRIGQQIGRSEEEAERIIGLAQIAGLLREREVVPEKRSRSWRHPHVLQSRRAVINTSDDAERWLGLSEAGRWLELSRAWLGAFVPATDAAAGDAPSRERLILDLLGEIPDGQGATAASLGALLSWRHPGAVGDATSGAGLATAAGSWLAVLGAGAGSPAIGLNAIGRLALSAKAVDAGALEAAFPASAEQCVVTADHRVVVSGPPAGDLARMLRVAAEVESVRPARVYRITASSLARALDGGLTAGTILDTLRAHTAGWSVPATVAALIEDVGRRHGRVRVGTTDVYVVTDDPAQLEEVMRDRSVGGDHLRRISPTVAVVEGRTSDEVLAALRRAGLMPVADGAPRSVPAQATASASDGAATAASSATRPSAVARPGPSPKPDRPLPLDAAGAARLIASLRASPALGDGLTAQRPWEDIVRDALGTAVNRRQPVELGYRGASGHLDLLTVRPYSLLRDEVWVQDARSYGSYKLELRRIMWVEAARSDAEARQSAPVAASSAASWAEVDLEDVEADEDLDEETRGDPAEAARWAAQQMGLVWRSTRARRRR